MLVQELIAVKFELADKTVALNKLRRASRTKGQDPNVSGLRSETKDSTPGGPRRPRRVDGGGQEGLGSGVMEGDSEEEEEEGEGEGDDGDLHSREMLYLAAEEGLDEIVKGILVGGHTLARARTRSHLHARDPLHARDSTYTACAQHAQTTVNTPIADARDPWYCVWGWQ